MATLEEVVVATLFDQSDNIADEVLHHNPLLAALDDRGNVRRFSGGYEIRKPVLFNDTAIGGFFSGFEAFDLEPASDFSAFQFAIRQCYEPLSISGRDRRANRDQEMLLDHVESKMQASTSRLKNTVSTSLRGDGTAFGGREFEGIQKMISTTPSTGTYGAIDRATNTWARNIAISVSGGFTAANVQENITDGLCRASRGDEAPDLGIMDRSTWKLLHSSMMAIQRITKTDRKALAGFRSMTYDGCDFVYDGGYGSTVLPTGQCRLINTKYVTFDLVRGADFKPLDPKLDRPIDQDAFFTVIIVEGNLCCSAPALQAVLS